tara:strand:- start:2305 stop:3096 length:792 start_codon:yes stop_codon:yes gene_type:complete
MFNNNFDPVAFTFLIFEIRWYSIAYILGILLGWVYIKKFIIQDSAIKKLFDNYISYLIIGIIFGGRLGYVLIYNLKYYLSNPIKIIYIWEGGMSFHGGLAGVIIVSYIFCKTHKLNTFTFLDFISLSAPIGIFFGRLANFLNSELYGRQTDILWSVKFLKIDNLDRHPSQIYEAIFEGLILFIILNFFLKSFIRIPGKISCFFLIFYSLFRFIIEFTREPDLQIGLIFKILSIGQVISIFTLLVGFILYNFLRNNKNEEKITY